MLEVTESKEGKNHIQKLGQKPSQSWQEEIVKALRQLIFQTIPAHHLRQFGV